MAWSIVLIGLLNTIYSWFRAPAKFSSNVVRSRDKCTSDWVNLSIPRNMDRNMDRWLHFSALVIVVLAIAQGITYILSAEYCAMFLSLQVTVSANRTLFFLGLIVFSQQLLTMTFLPASDAILTRTLYWLLTQDPAQHHSQTQPLV